MISIIIPVYNAAAYLSQCLDSLIGQTCRDIEVICVDDGSTDDSLQVLNDYAEKDSRVRVIHQENQGIAAARNRALTEARGEWMMFVDSDDWTDIRTCEVALSNVMSKDVDMVLWPYVREYNGTSLPKIFAQKQKLWDAQVLRRRVMGPIDEELRTPDTMDAWGTVWGKLYRTAIIKDNWLAFEDTREIGSAEDVLFNLDYLKHAKAALYIPETLYHYRKIGGESYTSHHQADLERKWSCLYAKLYVRVNDTVVRTDEIFKALHNRISLGIIGLGLNELYSGNSCFSHYKSIRRLLSREIYRSSITHLPLSFFPIHWRLFFACAKYQIALGVYIMMVIIRHILQRS